jgi:2-dehydro-3-deoxyphosphogluconate aldolase / (4S)-4-hydroxy-2-oxoglutarate aldolase
MAAPYSMVNFIPTGGVSTENMVEYLMFPKVTAVGGSWLAKSDMIKEGKFAEITALAKEAVVKMLGFDMAHIGINSPDADSSLSIARRFASLFNLPLKEGNSSNFAGKGIEINKSKGLGQHGHIAISTNSISRAAAYLERNGVAVDMSSAKKDSSGNMVAVYLKEEIGGFAVHLLQKK